MGTKGEAAGWRERFIGLREDLLLDNSRGNRDLPTEAGVLLGYARKKETLCCGPETSVREKGGVRSPETERGRGRRCAAGPARQRAKAEGRGGGELGLGLEGFLSFFFLFCFIFFLNLFQKGF